MLLSRFELEGAFEEEERGEESTAGKRAFWKNIKIYFSD